MADTFGMFQNNEGSIAMKPYKLFIPIQPGLEQTAIMELNALGIKDIVSAKGYVQCQGHLSTIIRLNIHSRTLSRIMIELGSFYADNFRKLCDEVQKLALSELLNLSHLPSKLCIRVSSYSSHLYHEGAIRERLFSELCSSMKREFNPVTACEDDTLLFVVHIAKNHVSIKLDSSGIHLHKRGYGKYVGLAPLRETIASAMVIASPIHAKTILLDPCCGSGTIPIEAALLNEGISFDRFRSYTFYSFKAYDDHLLALAQQSAPIRVQKPLQIIASDIDPKVIQVAMENAKKAGVQDLISFEVKELKKWTADSVKQCVIISNPPWGHRFENMPETDKILLRLSKSTQATTLLCPTQILPRAKTYFRIKSGEIALSCFGTA